ncbi:MAG: DUF3857 domain-containing protein [Porticoccaceae bacterium]|nr:DUF3857 domain-containing protein [Pseudomonadales bacterium]MCP5172479.1 DUF3857 domain-containing protein [Pseudomonadales bacterium]
MNLALLCCLMFGHSAFATDYAFDPVPDWVLHVKIEQKSQAALQSTSEGVDYQLVDQQWNVTDTKQIRYFHFINKALNSSGVGKVSHISIDFDPVYEKVYIHQIQLHRSGKVMDRIGRSKIDLIQREKNLESKIYNGTKTINVFLEDIRPGDVVEYSYSIEGANPVLLGHFSALLSMRWSVPVGRVYYRILWGLPRPLYIRNHGIDIEPIKKAVNQFKEYVWNQNSVEALVVDKSVPSWFEPFPVIYLSDVNDWQKVQRWAWPLYRPLINTPFQEEIVNSIQRVAKEPEQKVMEALHFVQNEVRYLGIEMGERSYQPSAPDQVIDRRFGDCKDKSRLLVSLLQSMGIEASTALVNTENGPQLMEMLPTPSAFNHAIVLVNLNGNNYWLDPTRSNQKGNLSTIYTPNYDYALVVSEHGTGLTKMSDDINAVHSKTVEEKFDIRDALIKPATYGIQTDYERYYADSVRQQLSETSLKEIQQSYLNYIAGYYPNVEVAKGMTFSDDSQMNRLSLKENYEIKDIWVENDDKRYVEIEFIPFLINDHVKSVEALVRDMPYAVTHPVSYRHTTEILVPENSSFDEEFFEVKDKAFRFTKKVTFLNDALLIDYFYESLRDHVLPEDIQVYSEKIKMVQELSYYQIQMPNPDVDFGEYHFDINDVNWLMIIIVFLAVIGFTFIGIKYVYLYDPVYQAPDNVNNQLQGLSGWLILPALALIASPVNILVSSAELWYVFSAEQWSIIYDRFDVEVLILIASEVVCNIAMVIMGVVVVFLFFTRRHTFPRFFIIYFMLMLSVFGLDLVVIYLMSDAGLEVEDSDISELLRLVFHTSIWSFYLLKSQRVKATFTRQLG